MRILWDGRPRAASHCSETDRIMPQSAAALTRHALDTKGLPSKKGEDSNSMANPISKCCVHESCADGLSTFTLDLLVAQYQSNQCRTPPQTLLLIVSGELTISQHIFRAGSEAALVHTRSRYSEVQHITELPLQVISVEFSSEFGQ